MQFFSIISLAIYFIWGQGFACAWWMYPIVILLAILAFTKKSSVFQCIISLFLLGITFFAPATFGYSNVQRNCYERGYREGKLVKDLGLSQDADSMWEEFCDQAGGDKVPKCKKFYMKGWNKAN